MISLHPRRAPLRRRAPLYRRLLVPLPADGGDERCIAEACMLCADGGAVSVLVPIEVPLKLPLEAPLDERAAHDALERARAIGLAHGVHVRGRVVRTRSAGETVVAEIGRSRADAVVVGMQRGRRLDRVAEHVLANAPCRVLIAAL